MAITFHIPGPLRTFTQGRAQVLIQESPATVQQAFSLLLREYPGLRDRLLTEEGEIREHINVFVGNESVRYSGGLATAINGPAEISIIPAISGGSAF